MKASGPIAVFCAALLPAAPASATSHTPDEAVFELSLEQLLTTEVTTVSRKPERSRDAPSAVYVISGEDLRRNHVTHLAEALRMVPGMHVARIDANRWAVNIRGGSSYFANRLLVQMDGRTLYSPVFSGTFWNVQDTVLEDVERIEVIRGPGAVMWGANAVNGIVNIITRNAADTSGSLVTANLGTEDNIAQYRHGARLNEDWHGRFYLRTRHSDELRQLEGGDNNDDWRMHQAGFRLDGAAAGSQGDQWTLQGDAYRGKESLRGTFPVLAGGTLLDTSDVELRGLNLLGRWVHAVDEDEELQVQAYYDRTVRLTPGILDFRLDIYDVEFQHLIRPGEHHRLIWGGGFRLTQDDFDGNPLFFFTPDTSSRRRWSSFIQYDFEAVPDTLNLIAGIKLEHNDFSHFEHQPSLKLLWRPSETQTFWASASRAVRTPDKAEHAINLALASLNPAPPPLVLVQLLPAPDTEAEKIYSLDLGHRWQLADSLTWDLTVFGRRLREELTAVAQPNPQVVLNENSGKEDFYGAEAVLDWQPREWWQLQAWWAHIEPKYGEAAVSRNHANLRSYMNLPQDFEVDGTLRYVDARSAQNIPSYVEMDLRLGWHASPELEFSLAFSHLLDNETVEAPVQSFIAFQQTEIQRAVSLKLTWTPGR